MSEKPKKKSFPWRRYLLLNWSLEVRCPPGQTRRTHKEIRRVILISIDTCRADHLGCYGYSRKTSPNIDAFATEGILFNHAVAPVPITLPSHSSMLTGTIPPYHKVRDNNNYRLSSPNVTLAELLRGNGFTTGAIVSAFVLNSQFGLDQGFDDYDDDIKRGRKGFLPLNERNAGEVTRLANIWLEKHKDDNFFLFLHYFDPHSPYKLHERFSFRSFHYLSLPRDSYDSEIAYTDYYIGKLIEKLKEMGLYDSTLIIVTSDHGESLNEHSEKTHAYFIYHSTVHVPLVIKIPGGPEGVVVGDVVGLIDIVPTVCGCLGIPIPPGVQGKDLNIFLSDKNPSFEKRYLFCESLTPTKFDLGPFLGLVGNRWKYIHSWEAELYDLEKDPHETKNLANRQTQQVRVMRGQLELVLQNSVASDITDNKVVIDQEARNRLASLGYVSDSIVDENIGLGRGKSDPKKFIEVYNFLQEFMVLTASNEFDRAKEICNEMLAEWPNLKQAYYYLGLVALSEKDMQAAITYLSRYLADTGSDADGFGMRIKPRYEFAVAHLNLAAAFKYEGQTKQAIAHYKKAEEIYMSLGMQEMAEDIRNQVRWYW